MDYENISDETWSKWTKKRRNTLIGYLIVGTMVGIDYSFMFTTLFLYLKDMIKTEHPNLFYGIIVAAYSLSSTIFGTLSGRWVDKTRNIKRYTAVIIILQILGCLLYVIHFNVAYPLIGRLIGGLGDPFPSVISGEIIRIYDKEESTRALWWIASVYSIGNMIGPIIVLFFKSVDFSIGPIHFTQLNVIGLFMAGLLLIALIGVYFLIHNCSAEFDLKEYVKEKKMRENIDPITNEKSLRRNNNNLEHATEGTSLLRNNNRYRTVPVKLIMKRLLTNTDSLLMLSSTFVFMYNLFASDVLTPLLAVELLKWNLTALTIIYVGTGVAYFVLMMIMSKYCTSERGVYIMSIICIVAQMFMFLVLIAMKILKRDLNRDIALMVIFASFWIFAWIIEEVIIRCMLSKLVPSHCQSFTETIRNGVSRLSTVVAAITAPLVLPCLHWWSGCLCIVTFLFFLGYVFRRKVLVNLKEIDFVDSVVC